jgi:hypothetical protein
MKVQRLMRWGKTLFLDPTPLFGRRVLLQARSLANLLEMMQVQIQYEHDYFTKALYRTDKIAPQILDSKTSYNNKKLIARAKKDILTPQAEMIAQELEFLQLELDMLDRLLHKGRYNSMQLDLQPLQTQIETEAAMFAKRQVLLRQTKDTYRSLEEGSSDTALMNRIRRELLSLEEDLEAHERQRLRLLLLELEKFTPPPSHSAPHPETAAQPSAPKVATVQTSAKHAQVGYTAHSDAAGDASSDDEAPSERLPMPVQQQQQRGPSRVHQSKSQHTHFHQHFHQGMFPDIIPFNP